MVDNIYQAGFVTPLRVHAEQLQEKMETMESDMSGLAALARQWEATATRFREERNAERRRAEQAEAQVRELTDDLNRVEAYHQAEKTVEEYYKQVRAYRQFVVDARHLLSPEMRQRALELPRMNEYLEAPTLFGEETPQEEQ